MKSLVSTAVLTFALLTPVVFAQATGNSPATSASDAQSQHTHNPHKAALRMGKQLGLTGDQTAKLEPILADRQEKISALRANTSLSEADRKQQMRSIQQSARMQMSHVLTPDQMQRLKAMRHGHDTEKAEPTGA